jgi:protein SCO1/2
MPLKWLKALLLVVLLGMPVLLYMFLQGFGENKYQVPVFYQDGIESPVQPGCLENQTSHRLDRYFIDAGLDLSTLEEKLVVFGFVKSDCHTEALSDIARICNQFKNENLFRATTIAVDAQATEEVQDELAKRYIIPQEVWAWLPYSNTVDHLIKCGFNLSIDCDLSRQLVLVDAESRIRGYYIVSDSKELDRLGTEINILLEN